MQRAQRGGARRAATPAQRRASSGVAGTSSKGTSAGWPSGSTATTVAYASPQWNTALPSAGVSPHTLTMTSMELPKMPVTCVP